MRKSALVLITFGFFIFQLAARTAPLPGEITNREFWDLVASLSETAGTFPQQYMSNEDSYQFVIPMLKTKTRRNGVYIGVGSEQNFTYIAAVQPQLSFLIDIRRDNMLEHLMYKALFELSPDRADFLSRLFSRRRPADVNAEATAKSLFDAFMSADVDTAVYEQNLQAVVDRLVTVHQFQLNDADKAGIARDLSAFRTAGPYSLKGYGDRTNPTYAQLMAMKDPDGDNQSYLASEDNFKIVRKLESENRIIPLVGDFAGDKALAGIGRFLKEHDATVDVFYVSNVERYLFDDFAHGKQFYKNVSELPLNASSVFIRSVTTDISQRLGFPLPAGKEKWRTFLFPINECLQGLDNGRIKSYRDLFAGVN